ncbi:DUF3127 domain-containing protein [Algoriphagus antarcticus]|uniref:Uncharacterized protein DUF3127 n=1 Tax=Algoriphagus antarcticus TaxID=238540 RepID=A0A3E0DMR1_9BACT|nr:DUF3127 domain-containing protein [Algoriphagus antarcticus]REG84074.1 uncharacterized protein DUF3127 [Algoriphagus antarcticus]
MELSGKVIQKLPEVGGNSKSGNAWRKQEFILETGGQYPKKVCVSLWGDKIDQFSINEGENVTLSIDVESREYNGRWYTEVKAFRVEKSGGGSAATSAMPEVDTFHSEGEEDKLPF